MNPKFYLLGILIILGANLNSHAQVSYNKRAMGSIGTTPKVASDFLNNVSLDNVDMTTGTLKIGIPLYEIKVNDISVPISLNYTATGIKVGQEAGPTGMGWELSAGGKIIRNVQGKVDNLSGTNFMPLEVLNNPFSFDPYATHRSLAQDAVDNKGDATWDTYSYILPNGGGTYVKDGTTFPYDPLISISHPGIIKTTDGVIYSFGAGDNMKTRRRIYYEPNTATPTWIVGGAPVQWTRDMYPNEYYDWDLKEIISTKFKDTVSFNYERIENNNPKLAAKTRISTSESLPLYRPVESAVENVYYEPTERFYRITSPIISQSKIEYITHTRIQSIKFPNGQVSFEYSVNDICGRDVLLNIKIYQIINGTTTILKEYTFDYDLTQITYGHYLTAINIFDGKGQKLGAWSFGYQNKLPVIPNVENFAQDRWGFYNGYSLNKTLLEHPDSVLALKVKPRLPIANEVNNYSSKNIKYTRQEATELYGLNNGMNVNGVTTYSINFANRAPNFLQSLRGTLTSVKMPTGATFTYEYEPHKFLLEVYPNNAYQQSAFIGGGIRIKSITKDLGHDSLYTGAPEGKVIIKKYGYGQGSYSSSGSSLENNGYGNVTIPGNVLGNVSKYYSTANPTVTWDINNIMLLSHPVNSLVQNNGSYVMYQSVSESIMTGYYDDTYGKTVYYNTVPVYADAPDHPWRNNANSSLNDIALPYIYVNAGVKKELMIGTNGIKKFAFRNGNYIGLEETKYYFKSFNAPPTAQYQMRLLSLYITVASQISGPIPVSNPGIVLRDPGIPADRGGSIVNLFNATHNSNPYGEMDYLAATNLIQEPNTPNFPGRYAYQLIDMTSLSNCIKKESEQTITYSDDGGSTASTATITDIKYYYDNPAHLLPSRIVKVNSQGDSIITRTKYAQDYAYGITAIDYMKANKLALSEPLEEFMTYKSGVNEYVNEGIVNTQKVDNNVVYNDKTYKMNVSGAVAYAGPYYSTLDTTRFKPQISYDDYLKGNIYKYTEANGSGNVVLWGYNNQYPIAKVANASIGGYTPSEEVAYSSFESSEKGNWIYSGNPVTDLTSPSGKRVYSLANGSLSKIKPTSLPAKRYLISYWYKQGSTVNISGGTLGGVTIKNTKAGWSLAEREISAITGSIVVSGTGSIDELRFHPYDAQMTTYTYEPLLGLSGSIDPKGNLQYYEYDDAQRLKNVRDQKGNIVKSYRYNLGTSN